MARVHLFTTSTTPHHERRRQSLSPEHSIADDAPSPSTENITIAANATPAQEDVGTVDVDAVAAAAAAAAASPSTVNMSQASLSTPASPLASHEQQQQQQDLASSTAALTAALLQSAHGHEDVSNAVAAALSGKSDACSGLASPQQPSQEQHDASQTQEEQPQSKAQDAIEQATAAATALQLLGLSHSDSTTADQAKTTDQHPQQQQQHIASTSNSSATVDANNVMLIANYPGLNSNIEEIDLSSDDMIQDYKRGTWTREEDELLLAGIKKFGYGRWKEIATSIPGRKGKQLKQRWDNTLAAKYVDQEWLKNKIRSEEQLHQQQQQQQQQQQAARALSMMDMDKASHGGASSSHTAGSSDDKALKFLEATDWNDIALKISEKARVGDQHAIEALLSQALLGTVANHATATATPATTAPTTANVSTNATSSPVIGGGDGGSSTPMNTSTVSSPVQPPLQHHQQQQNFDNFALQHPSAPGTPSASSNNNNDGSLDLNNFSRSLDNNPPPLTLADAAALALYANQLSQHSNSNANNYFMPFGSASTSNNDTSVAAAAAAAAAAVAAVQQHQQSDSQHSQAYSSPSPNKTAASNTASPSLSSAVGAAASSSATGAASSSSSNSHKMATGGKRRRSDPALADTQSAAMSIYASATPITTTINNQTQTVFPCLFPNCGKTFARLYNLKSHSRTHTDDRPFVCHACTAAFSRNHDLKRHSKIHGGDKPYRCEGCQKSFSRLDALKRHKSNQRNKQSCTGN